MSRRNRFFPLLVLLGVGIMVYLIWCKVINKPIMQTNLIGWSPYNSSPMPSSPAGQSHTMGGGVQAR